MTILQENKNFSYSISDTAKILGLKRKDLIELLKKNSWIFKRSKFWLGYAESEKVGFILHRKITVQHNSGDVEHIPQVRITNKGIAWLESNLHRLLIT